MSYGYRASAFLTSRAGIAIGPILLIVAVLAVLATAIAAGGNSFTNNTTTEENNVAAEVIISYGHEVQQAVQRSLALGAQWQNLSFGTTGQAVTITNGTTSDLSSNGGCTVSACKVFDAAGGGARYRDMYKYAVQDPMTDTPGWQITWERPGTSRFLMFTTTGVGSGVNKIVMQMLSLRAGVCNAINQRLGNSPVAVSGSYLAFSGVGQGPCGATCDNTAYTVNLSAQKNKLMFTDFGSCNYYAVVLVR